uniref:NADH-ubiquinone oxidoreductase chain 5 n=1 Tax=Omophoita sp. REN-2018 TaxID=2506509 RepID=A0A411D9Z7_9CUCU|nr:NADH dehydrogenase subunit 5 [Omophoita sp. REN-2018]
MCFMFFIWFLLMSSFLLLMSLYFLMNEMVYVIEYLFMILNSVNFIYIILLDWMSLMFMSFVLFISSMVIYYSEEYMSMDLNKNRFILLVVMFVMSMMFMIISPNLISILLGWDGLGLVSYCLVIYYQNVKSFNAGMLTALSNRVGDVALLMAIAWMLNFGSWSFIYYLDIMKNNYIMMVISMFVIIAAMTKSAQIPFSSWLPAAMAAPTPVSSLVHSSTLVTAGVYLLIRFSEVFNKEFMFYLLFISSLTMFMAGLGANFEYDLKKIIALSTLSQLGLMMSVLALGNSMLAFFHLLIHALFKALLFMCAGVIIHSMSNCQDIRYMGGLIKNMPLTCSYMNICNWALCGLPFLSGFYSKDLIVEYMSMTYLNFFIYMIFYISIGLTVAYSFRLSYYSLMGNFNFISLNLIYESGLMLKTMSGLILFVVISGSLVSWLIFFNPIYINLSLIMKMMTLLLIMIGMYLGYEISKFKISYVLMSHKFMFLTFFYSLMWNLPILSTLGINYSVIYLGDLYLKLFDQGWIEYYGGKSLINLTMKMKLQLLSFNHLKVYLMMLVIWMLYLFMNL